MKPLIHPAVTALGIATLCLISKISFLTSPEHLVVYHYEGKAWPLFASTIVDFAALSLLLMSLLRFTERRDRSRAVLRCALVCGLPWVALRGFFAIFEWAEPSQVSMLLLFSSFVAFLVFVFVPILEPAFERIWELSTTILGFVAIAGLIAVAELFCFGWQARHLNSSLPLHQHSDFSKSGETKPRVIWILLDELSYQQVYERRFPGLQLPAFDRLATQSTVFTQTIPSGTYTERVIPSLFTGQVVDRLRASADGQLASVRNKDSGRWQRFDQHDTVFQDALDTGYSTAVAGWYNPYCRILPQVLDQCFWRGRVPRINGLLLDGSLSATMSDLLRRKSDAMESLCFWWQRKRSPVEDSPAAAVHIADYNDISLAADTLLRDRSLDFVFLHMPVPHPEGIYDRKTNQFVTSHSTYIDNLVLADKTLAHIRGVLGQGNDWDSSAVVVMGDHSWRTGIWSPQASWTPEEQIASQGGQFDNRPVYIVKLPYQQNASRFNTSYPAIRTRALLDAILHRQVRTDSELSLWARQTHY